MRAVRPGQNQRGATTIHVLVLLVPVFFGFIGFAIDLGQLYLARAEIKSAANAMALAAASQLIGTAASLTNAEAASKLPIENSGGFANKYNFGSVVIGEGSGRLSSPSPEPEFFDTVSAATGEGDSSDASSGSNTARVVRIDIQADAPLTFFGLLSLGQDRKTPVAARAVAGVSAALCTACGIEPIAVAPLNADDTTDFGFIANTRYTLGYTCTGANQPQGLAGATQRVPYIMIDRYNQNATLFPDESSQAFRAGAGGLPGNSDRTLACVAVNNVETVWASAAPQVCTAQKPATVTYFGCGLASRFDSALATGCDVVASSSDIITAYTPDSDITDLDDYTAYTGTTRRVITVPIVDSLTTTTAMTVLGFRQFLIEPNQNDINITPSDTNGRFVVLYLGSPVPLKQGYMGGCNITSGPGKVVLHQ